MPRKKRSFKEGGIYHVFNRGIEKRDIFLDDQDRSRFILGLEFFNSEESSDLWRFLRKESLRSGLSRYKLDTKALKEIRENRQNENDKLVELLAFCLMPNHHHLIIREIAEGGIISFMRKMGGYSWYFNNRYNRVGPLFQGRYKSVEVKDDNQLEATFCYVHTNPVELWEPGWKDFKVRDTKEVLKKLENYRWSSYLDYIEIKNFPKATQRELFRDFFKTRDSCKQSIFNWVGWRAQVDGPTLHLL